MGLLIISLMTNCGISTGAPITVKSAFSMAGAKPFAVAIIVLFLVSPSAKSLASIAKSKEPVVLVPGRVNQSLNPVLFLFSILILSSMTKPITVAPVPVRELEIVPVFPAMRVSVSTEGSKESVPLTGMSVLSMTSIWVILELNPPNPVIVKSPSVTSTTMVSTTVWPGVGTNAGMMVYPSRVAL